MSVVIRLKVTIDMHYTVIPMGTSKVNSSRCWYGYLSGASSRLAYGPADATATHCLLLQVVSEKGPLNVCVCVCVCVK